MFLYQHKNTKTILQNWVKAGIKTVEQVKAEELKHKNQKAEKPIKQTCCEGQKIKDLMWFD